MTDEIDTRGWDRLRMLFEEALPLPAAERELLLARLAEDDPELAPTLGEMLAAHDRFNERTGAERSRLLDSAMQRITSFALHPGARVGAYELREVLGRGGMGVVFRADRVDGLIQHEAAIKVVPRTLFSEAALQRFLLEREIVAGFEHPYIARLYDVGETADGAPYSVMELIRGEPVTTYCDRNRLDIRSRLELFLKICEAVQHAHGKLILHRDIKPGNVLVAGDGTPRLIDFGIAKSIATVDAKTGTHERFFSPSNAAPEQLRGDAAGVACDVYQLGALLYELLCGATIFGSSGVTPAQLEQQILEHVPDPPSRRAAAAGVDAAQARGEPSPAALARTLRGDLDNIALQALRKRPQERYASAEQLADDVRRYLAFKPVVAHRGQQWYRVRKFVRRNRVGVGLAAVAFVAAATFIAAILVQTNRLEIERDVARQERDRADKGAQFLVDVFSSADPSESLSREVPLGTILDNGRRQLEMELSDEPVLRVRMLGVLARVYTTMGDSATASSLLADADRTVATSAPLPDRAMIEYLLNRGGVHSEAGNSKEARASAQQALDIHARLGDSRGSQWRARRLLLDVTLDQRDRAAQTQAMVDLLRDMKAEPTLDRKFVASVQASVANALAFDQKNELAEPLLLEAIADLDRLYPKNHPTPVGARIALALLLDNTGRSTEALEVLRGILAAHEQVLGERSASAAATKVRMGRVLIRLGRHEEAVAIMEEALAIQRSIRTSPHWDFTVTQGTIGNALFELRRYDEAAERYLEALRVAEELGGPTSSNTVAVRARLGGVRAKQGRLEEAERLLRDVVAAISFEWHGHAAWGLEYAEVLEKLGKAREASQVLARVKPLLAQFPAVETALRARVDELDARLKAGGGG